MADSSKIRGDGDSVTLWSQTTARAAFTVSSLPSGSTLNGVSWTFSTDRNDYYVWYNVTDAAGGVSDPALPGVGIPVSLTTAQTANGSVIMAQTLAQLTKLSEIGVTQTASALSIVVREPGDVTDAVAAASPFGVDITTSGIADVELDAKFVIHGSNGDLNYVEAQDGVVYNVQASAQHLVREMNLVVPPAAVGWGAASQLTVKGDNRVYGSGLAGSALLGNGSAISGVL